MRFYTQKLTAIFALVFVFFAAVLFFVYTAIDTQYLSFRAMENLKNINQSTAVRIEQSLRLDLDRLDAFIADAEMAGRDIDTAVLEDFRAQSNPVRLVAEHVENVGFRIDGTLYRFSSNPFYNPLNAVHTLNINRLSDMLEDYDDNTLYLIMQTEDGRLVLFDAYHYFEPLFITGEVRRVNYFIIDTYAQIFYQDDQASSSKFFFIDVMQVGPNNLQANQMQDALENREHNALRTNLFGQAVYLVSSPLSESFSAGHQPDFYSFHIIQTFDITDSIAPFAYLRNALLGVFILTGLLSFVGLFFIYRLVLSKNNDLESSRLTHYYEKPYIVKVGHRANIRWVNRTFKRNVSDYKAYKQLGDMAFTQPPEDILDHIKRQRTLTAILPFKEEKRYIHFTVVKSPGGYTLVGDDMTDIEGRYDSLRMLALTNPITLLPNRNQMIGDLEVLLKKQRIDEAKHSLIGIEIVSIKRIKLLMSEKIVRATLNAIKSRLEETLEKSDATVYHTDDNTFVVLMHNLPNHGAVISFVDRLNQVISDQAATDKNLLDIEMKFGIFHIEPEKYAQLNERLCLEHVSLAIEHAKTSTAQDVVIFNLGLTKFTTLDELMEVDLAKAIQNEDFIMYFQPQIDHDENRIFGLEALIRWPHPRYINESPLKFIKLAEHNNMIIEIGRIAMRRTFEVMKKFEPYDVEVSINVSPVQMMQVGFVNEMIALRNAYDIKENVICIEITETFLMTSFEQIIDKLRVLRNNGFNIHLDDFGTGYSSLAYLSDLPINTLKIDRAFIEHIETDRYSRAIVGTVASLAKNVGFEVIAEGVETPNQYQLLRRAGYNRFQGFIFSPAVNLSTILEMLEDYNIKRSKTFDFTKSSRSRKK
ncbi:MAG: GGDEF domain-containing protein [Acholeplasmatales bacterium]|nr:MAG: GGDEF domain-containing protein [Acholeplasmatales bacterium]